MNSEMKPMIFLQKTDFTTDMRRSMTSLPMVVLFKSNMCSHCVKIGPEYEAFFKEMNNSEIPLIVSAVNTGTDFKGVDLEEFFENHSIMNNQGEMVQVNYPGIPFIVFFYKGKIRDVHHDDGDKRTKRHFVNFAKEKINKIKNNISEREWKIMKDEKNRWMKNLVRK